MQFGVLERGDRVKTKLVKYGHPVAEVTVVNLDMAHFGTMKVRTTEGSEMLGFFPPLEVLT